MAYRQNIETQLAQAFKACENQHMFLAVSSKRDVAALGLRAKHNDVVKVLRGFYARKTYWDSLNPPEKAQHIIRTYSNLHPGLIFSHTSAAIMYGLQVHWDYLKPMHVVISNTRRGKKSAEIIRHRIANPIGIPKDNVTVTSLEQTIVDCVINFPLLVSLPIADSALHLGLTNKARLINYLENRGSSRGVRIARHVIELADPRPDNGGESQVRAVIIECGLPSPDLQVPVEDLSRPGHMYYVDFMFERADGVKIAMELDGREKYESPEMTKGQGMGEVMRRERRREALLTSHGLQVVRFSYWEAIDLEILLPRLALYGIKPEKTNGKAGKAIF